jgi:hypothetical protein
MTTEWGWRNSHRKWNSTWRSEINWGDLKLSRAMRTTLQQLITKPSETHRIAESTHKALHRRRLVDSTGSLTESGFIAGLSTASLRDQCSILGIPIEFVKLNRKYNDPAVDGMYHLMDQGFRCSYEEGAILRKVLYCSYFHRLPELTKEGWKSFLEGMGTMPLAIGLGLFDFEDYVKDHATIADSLKDAVATVTRDVFQKNYRALFPKGYCWFGADERFATKLFDHIGNERLMQILDTFLFDPYAFSNGWPDLTSIGDEKFELVEVKEKDKLTVSQLITMPAMIKAASIPVKVLHVSRV